MAATPREQYQRERTKVTARAGDTLIDPDRYDDLNTYATSGNDAALTEALDTLGAESFDDVGTITHADADAILEFLDARDENMFSVAHPEIDTTDSGNSLRSYTNTLRTVAERLEAQLIDATPDDLNHLMELHLTGGHPAVPEGGLAKSTISSYQGILTGFVRYHHGEDAADDVTVISPGQPDRDPEEMVFSYDEMDAMRDAIDHPRDRALFEFLLNTGQRIRVAETLRIGDVDLDAREYSLPKDVDGLKGADRNGRTRGLYHATAPMRNWLRDHPAADDDEAYVFTQLPSWSRGGEGGQLTPQSIRRTLKDIGERAGLDRDAVHAHKFRHTWTTIAKRDLGISDTDIKHNLGHAKGSTVMETTYSWLDDGDVITSIESKLGIGPDDEADHGVLTPSVCETCGENLQQEWTVCPRCREPLTDAIGEFDEEVDSATTETMADPDPEVATEEAEIAARLRALDPEDKAALVTFLDS